MKQRNFLIGGISRKQSSVCAMAPNKQSFAISHPSFRKTKAITPKKPLKPCLELQTNSSKTCKLVMIPHHQPFIQRMKSGSGRGIASSITSWQIPPYSPHVNHLKEGVFKCKAMVSKRMKTPRQARFSWSHIHLHNHLGQSLLLSRTHYQETRTPSHEVGIRLIQLETRWPSRLEERTFHITPDSGAQSRWMIFHDRLITMSDLSWQPGSQTAGACPLFPPSPSSPFPSSTR